MDWGLPYKDEAASATDKNIHFFNIPEQRLIIRRMM